MSCGGSCKCAPCSGLSAYPVTAGQSVPYHLTASEIQAFLSAHLDDGNLSRYIDTHLPEWGIIVNENQNQFLVWYDARNVLHVVNVTNMEIAAQVQQAPYESPGSSFFENIQQSFNNLFVTTQGLAVVVGVVALAYLVYKAAR